MSWLLVKVKNCSVINILREWSSALALKKKVKGLINDERDPEGQNVTKEYHAFVPHNTRSYWRHKEVIISLNKLFILHTSNLFAGFFIYFTHVWSTFVSSEGYKLFRRHESKSPANFINLNSGSLTVH